VADQPALPAQQARFDGIRHDILVHRETLNRLMSTELRFA